MRKQQHRQPFTSLFTSKRFVVAFCAAIAMVLGAMSVGANTPDPEGPSAMPVPPAANQADPLLRISRTDNDNPPGQAETSNPVQRPFLEYQPSIIINPDKSSDTKNQQLKNTPLKGLEILLNLKPAETLVTPAVPLLPEIAIIEPGLTTAAVPETVETPLQGTGLPEETPPPAVESVPENSPEILTE